MSLELYRQSLVSAVESVRPSFDALYYPLKVEYDNRETVDLSTQSQPYLIVKVKWNDAYQADLAAKPIQRITGHLELISATKEGDGVARGLIMIDHFYTRLQQRQFGRVHTHIGDLTPELSKSGWRYQPALIPFWIHRVTE